MHNVNLTKFNMGKYWVIYIALKLRLACMLYMYEAIILNKILLQILYPKDT